MRNKLLHRLTLIPEAIRLYYWIVRLGVRNFAAFFHDYRLIEKSGLFWPSQYLQDAGERIAGHVDPIAHYLAIGSENGMDPNLLFDTSYYLEVYPDVQTNNINPLVHYIVFGGAEGRSTHRLFDGQYYREQYGHLLVHGTNPLVDFLENGCSGKRDPCLLFKSDFYLTEHPQAAESELNPLVHYLQSGAQQGLNPSQLFNTDYYVSHYSSLIKPGDNPLVYFLERGGYSGHHPSPLFDTTYYLEVNPDIRAADVIPLIHFLEFGYKEGRYRFDLYQHWYLDQEVIGNIANLTYAPVISVIMPVYNTEEKWLRRAIASVLDQAYPHWELCIADDGSTDPAVRTILEEFKAQDQRLKVIYRAETGHISTASNTALTLATGEFVALMDHDDEISPNALYEIANTLNQSPDADLIYTDEDKINHNNTRYDPFFKPDWSPDLLMSQMYSGHLGVYRRSLVEEIGGFRKGYEGSQDYDLVLRLTELTDRIHHVPKVLYHWRTAEGSTAADPTAKEYAYVAGCRALQDAVDRRDTPGTATRVAHYHGQYIVNYALDHHPAVSIVIPTWSRAGRRENLNRCLDSIFANTDYEDYEVIVVGSQVSNPDPFQFVDQLKDEYGRRLRVIDSDQRHNVSQLINDGTRHARGEFIALLGDSLIIQNQDWLRTMVGQAQRQNIGAVGGLICNDNETVRSAGIVVSSSNKVIDMHRNMPADSPGYFGRLLISSNCSAVRSSCLAIKKSLFEKKGGMDEALTDGFADIDLGLWLKEQGYQNILLSHVRAVQSSAVGPQPGPTVASDDHQNRQLESLRYRWGKQLDQDPFYNPNLSISGGGFRLDDAFLPDNIRTSMKVWLDMES